MRYLLLLLFLGSSLLQAGLPRVSPENAGLNPRALEHADRAIERAVTEKTIPGAVLAVVYKQKLVWLKAYGHRQTEPRLLPMRTNTLFDLASLTKPLATGTTVMQLIEQGRLRLADKVSDFLPGFKSWQDSSGHTRPIRIIHLLTHCSGLPAYAHPSLLKKLYGQVDRATLEKHIDTVERLYEPGREFKYSGLNMISLQRIIEQISGEKLADYTRERIFRPLNMHDTAFRLTPEQIERCAPTEILADGTLLKGVVHDPMAREAMNGLSSNAGLFSTAEDLAVYAAMLLNKGRAGKSAILSPRAVWRFTHIPDGYEKIGRALTWDVSSPYASNQGDLLSAETYGHTGYTGTSLVIDPQNNLAIILLTNRVHPRDKGSVVRLRGEVANAVAGALP